VLHIVPVTFIENHWSLLSREPVVAVSCVFLVLILFSLFRPSIKELLAKDFFAEDTGFKVELAQREELVKSDKNDVNFRLRSVGQP
jgi:hypothetical protein